MTRVRSFFRQGLALHSVFAKLHGTEAKADFAADPPGGQREGLAAAYAEYASATAHASAMLQKHGPASVEFARADVASMRLFHRVKKMQGLGKPGKARNS